MLLSHEDSLDLWNRGNPMKGTIRNSGPDIVLQPPLQRTGKSGGVYIVVGAAGNLNPSESIFSSSRRTASNRCDLRSAAVSSDGIAANSSQGGAISSFAAVQSKNAVEESLLSMFDGQDWNHFEQAQVVYPERRATADVVSIVVLMAVLGSTLVGYTWFGSFVRHFFA